MNQKKSGSTTGGFIKRNSVSVIEIAIELQNAFFRTRLK